MFEPQPFDVFTRALDNLGHSASRLEFRRNAFNLLDALLPVVRFEMRAPVVQDSVERAQLHCLKAMAALLPRRGHPSNPLWDAHQHRYDLLHLATICLRAQYFKGVCHALRLIDPQDRENEVEIVEEGFEIMLVGAQMCANLNTPTAGKQGLILLGSAADWWLNTRDDNIEYVEPRDVPIHIKKLYTELRELTFGPLEHWSDPPYLRSPPTITINGKYNELTHYNFVRKLRLDNIDAHAILRLLQDRAAAQCIFCTKYHGALLCGAPETGRACITTSHYGVPCDIVVQQTVLSKAHWSILTLPPLQNYEKLAGNYSAVYNALVDLPTQQHLMRRSSTEQILLGLIYWRRDQCLCCIFGRLPGLGRRVEGVDLGPCTAQVTARKRLGWREMVACQSCRLCYPIDGWACQVVVLENGRFKRMALPLRRGGNSRVFGTVWGDAEDENRVLDHAVATARIEPMLPAENEAIRAQVEAELLAEQQRAEQESDDNRRREEREEVNSMFQIRDVGESLKALKIREAEKGQGIKRPKQQRYSTRIIRPPIVVQQIVVRQRLESDTDSESEMPPAPATKPSRKTRSQLHTASNPSQARAEIGREWEEAAMRKAKNEAARRKAKGKAPEKLPRRRPSPVIAESSAMGAARGYAKQHMEEYNGREMEKDVIQPEQPGELVHDVRKEPSKTPRTPPAAARDLPGANSDGSEAPLIRDAATPSKTRADSSPGDSDTRRTGRTGRNGAVRKTRAGTSAGDSNTRRSHRQSAQKKRYADGNSSGSEGDQARRNAALKNIRDVRRKRQKQKEAEAPEEEEEVAEEQQDPKHRAMSTDSEAEPESDEMPLEPRISRVPETRGGWGVGPAYRTSRKKGPGLGTTNPFLRR